ncbi:MAG TPA: peptidylprolyl isomerase [Chitinophagaceae bacterium]|nr:peptidylprolyl isomerase [Chitinophagaceae bacterium]
MKKLLSAAFPLLLATAAMAQQKVVADKIVGIVGDKIILKSEIFIANEDVKRQGGQEQDPCMILDGMLVQKALVLQAEKDSIPVTDEEIDAEIDQKIRYFVAQYGSKEALEQIAGRSIYQMREEFRQPIKEQRMAQGMRNKIVDGIKITPSEVKEYYDRIPKDSLLFYESELQIGQIVVYPKASRDIEQLAIEELNEYKQQVESGSRRFETLASLYSDDPGSKDKGGMYQVNRLEKQWDPVFLAAAFRLKDGQISPVIKTKFGYHIIQMVSRNGDDAVIRHILRIPQITQPEIDLATAKLDTIRQQLVSGSIGFGEAVAKYSDDENAKFTAGILMGHDGSNYLKIDELDKDMVLLLKKSNLNAGQYSQPSVFSDDRGKKGVRIIYLISKSEPHRENMKDDYNRIAQRALEEKKNKALQTWFQSRISTYYIMIDGDYRNCGNLSKWQTRQFTSAN